MRIGIDASRAFTDQPTGTERYAYELITRILKLPEAREHEWILYVSPSSIPPLNVRGGKGVIFKRIPLRYLWTQVGLAMRTWVDDLDVLWVPAHTLPVFRKPGIKTVVTIHGVEYEWLPAFENKLQRWYLPLSTKYAVATAVKVIAVSKFTKQQLIERLGADTNKIQVVYEGYTANLSKIKLKTKKYLLFVGTVQPRKNLDRLIEAFLKLPFDSAQGDKLKLVIAGKLGWGYEKVVEMANNSGGKVILMGYVSDKERQELFAGALVYVQPSITEGFGLPVLEAMAARVPVVSSGGGALAEVIGWAGLLFDPFDINDMAEKLKLIVEDAVLRQKLIERGMKRVGEFGWDKAAKETYSVLTKF